MTDTAPPNDRLRETRDEADAALIRVEYPAPAPRSAAPATSARRASPWSPSIGPKALNALSFDLLDQLATALETLDADPACRAIVLTGAGDRAFAAGADIRELATADVRIARTPVAGSGPGIGSAPIGLPLIAAVRGFALGGGCELAMTCDMIVAAEDATFGQPEILLGVMPGAGGTQRLTRAIGKARAMELILTGRSMSAREAEARGLVTRVVPAEATLDAALELAATIATMPPRAVRAAKAAILDAAERSLSDGLARERDGILRAVRYR